MGGQESKNTEFQEASKVFSDGEKEKITELYRRICKNKERGIVLEDLKVKMDLNGDTMIMYVWPLKTNDLDNINKNIGLKTHDCTQPCEGKFCLSCAPDLCEGY